MDIDATDFLTLAFAVLCSPLVLLYTKYSPVRQRRPYGCFPFELI